MKIKNLFLLTLFACSMACFNGCQSDSAESGTKKEAATEADAPAPDPTEKKVDAPPA